MVATTKHGIDLLALRSDHAQHTIHLYIEDSLLERPMYMAAPRRGIQRGQSSDPLEKNSGIPPGFPSEFRDGII